MSCCCSGTSAEMKCWMQLLHCGLTTVLSAENFKYSIGEYHSKQKKNQHLLTEVLLSKSPIAKKGAFFHSVGVCINIPVQKWLQYGRIILLLYIAISLLFYSILADRHWTFCLIRLLNVSSCGAVREQFTQLSFQSPLTTLMFASASIKLMMKEMHHSRPYPVLYEYTSITTNISLQRSLFGAFLYYTK